MERLIDLLEQSNRAGINFLLVEMETAMTFLGVARTTRSEATAARNRNNALTVYESVLHYQARVYFDAEEKISFTDKLAHVQEALIAVGFAV